MPLSLHMDDGGEQHLLGARADERLVLCPALCGAVASTTEYWTQEVLAACPLLYNLLRLFGFEATLAVNNIAVKAHQRTCSALQVMVPAHAILFRG